MESAYQVNWPDDVDLQETTQLLTQALSTSLFDSQCFPAFPVPADHYHLSAERIPITRMRCPKA